MSAGSGYQLIDLCNKAPLGQAIGSMRHNEGMGMSYLPIDKSVVQCGCLIASLRVHRRLERRFP
jgi:hypothetical protein